MSRDSLLSVPVVANQLGISTFTLARIYKRGEIAFVRVGRSVRFRPEAVETYIRRQTGRAA